MLLSFSYLSIDFWISQNRFARFFLKKISCFQKVKNEEKNSGKDFLTKENFKFYQKQKTVSDTDTEFKLTV